MRAHRREGSRPRDPSLVGLGGTCRAVVCGGGTCRAVVCEGGFEAFVIREEKRARAPPVTPNAASRLAPRVSEFVRAVEAR